MAGTRSALIVATYAYDDPGLTRLRAPARDAEELADVLADPDIGGFEVETVLNQPWHQVSLAVARFFQNRKPDDLLLLHFSCHGVKDDSGELYFAASDTHLDLLEASAVASTFVNKAMDRSRAGRILLLLDCCYSGAFARGMATRGTDVVDVNERLGGRGRAVITASSALQYAFEGNVLDTSPDAVTPSVFTSALVRGLQTGEADRDQDGWVSLDELYAYVHDEVTRENPDQTPKKWAFDMEGDVYVARRGAPVTTPSELPQPIQDSMSSLLNWERESAVQPLLVLLSAEHPGRALAARQALTELAAHDDSDRVKAAARAALASVEVEAEPEPVTEPVPESEPESEPEPEPEPVSQRQPNPVAEPVVVPLAEPEQIDVPPSDVPPPDRELMGSSGTGGRRTAVVAGAVAGALVVTALVVWLATRGSDEDNDGGAARLPDSQVLLTHKQGDDPQQLVAYDVEADTGNSEAIIDDPEATLPTISPDREWFVYLEGTGKGTPRVPHLVRVDGSDDTLLLDQDLTYECPGTSRPAWSPDGQQLAFVCMGADNDPTGLWVVHRDGTGAKELVDSSSPVESPTWGTDGRIYFINSASDGAPTGVSWVPAAGGEPTELTDGSQGWDSHPDWAGDALVFLRSPAQRAAGSIWSIVPGSPEKLVGGDGTIESPTLSPDNQSGLWLESSGDGDALWVAFDGGEEQQLSITGKLGPPAWGSR